MWQDSIPKDEENPYMIWIPIAVLSAAPTRSRPTQAIPIISAVISPFIAG
jgi:hypothetical protein